MYKKIAYFVFGALLASALTLVVVGLVGDGLHSLLVKSTVAQQVKPHLTIYHAPWCQYCPTQDQINKFIKDHPNVDVCDIDIDKHPEAGVRKIPLFVLSYEGEEAKTNNFDKAKEWLANIARLQSTDR